MSFSQFIKQYTMELSVVATMMVVSGIFFIFLFTVVFFTLRTWLYQRSKIYRDSSGKRRPTIAFFHPYCNAGGGGERVLWVAIRSIQKMYPDVQCIVYTGDTDATPNEIVARAAQRFNILLPSQVEFVYLQHRHWVEAVKYPYFTLLGQSVGSLFLGLEALSTVVPDVYFDTMGYAFTLPLFRYLGRCSVACYVHYPTISTDMLTKVTQRVEAHNNASFISKSFLLSGMKILYYRLFAYCYGVAGKRSNVIMVNSTWTYNHIMSLWGAPQKTSIVYPPCDISEFMKIPLDCRKEDKPHHILSVSQFRPEKDHPLQIKSFNKFLKSLSSEKSCKDYKLVLAGSCRNEEDRMRVKTLQRLSEDLGIEELVEFRVNISFSELKESLAKSVISLHTMWNEHFGISVVEGMAAGTVMIAHDSGGPRMDIVVPHNDRPTGFLASDVDSYANAMKTVFDMSPEDRLQLRQHARESLFRFSEEEFEATFMSLCRPLLKKLGKAQ